MRERPAQTVSRAETDSGRRAGSGVSGRNPAVSPERLSPTVQAELQQALGFGEAELVANREGRITRRQAVRLALRDATTWIAFAFFAILLIASVLYVLLVPGRRGHEPRGPDVGDRGAGADGPRFLVRPFPDRGR